ncbi:MAG: tetratricopeptide repeat protein [Caulobacteraceae bacterium]
MPVRRKKARQSGLLRFCAFGLAFLASTGSYGLTAAAATSAAAAASPMDIRVGQSNGFSRVEFHWKGNVGYTTRREGDNLVVRFSRDADPDMSRLRVDPPPFLKTASLRRQGKILEVVLTLQPGADAKPGRDNDCVYVNLFPKPPEGPQAAPAAPKVDPTPAGGVVRMEGEIAQGQVLLRFPWKAPLGAAAFRRGESVWLVFDTAAKLDVSKAPAETTMFKGLAVVSGPGYSAVRIASPAAAPVKAWADGSTWTIALGPGVQKLATPVKAERDSDSPTPGLRTQLSGATKTLWLDDPTVGDRLAVVTALGPSKGVPGRRSYVDFALLPSAQGLAFEPQVPDLGVAIDGEWVRISRPKGLALSTVVAAAGAKGKPASASLGLPQPASMPGLVDYAAWSRTGEMGFMGRYSQLQNAAADEAGREAAGDRAAGLNARMALARFLVGSELGFEAIGELNLLLRHHQELAGDPEFRGLRGAARAMVGRYKEAENDFSVPVLADDPASSLWRGYIASKENDWQASADAFVKGMSAMNQFTPAWQSRFARAYAETAVETGKLNVASTEVALSIAQTKDPVEQLQTRLVQARLIEAMGYPKRALPLYDAIARAPLDMLSAPAQMHAAELRLQLGQISQSQAVALLDGLCFRWRGNRVELELIRNLGRLYLQGGHYREALETLRSISNAPIQAPEMADIHNDLSGIFRALFLDGRADGLEPVQAVGLWYEFKDLTPIGADGDLMVRKLARRLVDVDLLGQATELLKYQVDNRLDGIAKAQVATDLATLYIMDRRPEQAIEALNNSRSTLLPKDLQDQRRMIEARAWLALNQNDHALELVGKDASPDADGVRAEVAWRLRQWNLVGSLLEKVLGERWKKPEPLAPDQEAMLLRAGVAYSLASNDSALDRLRGHFSGFVDQAHSAEALRVALAGAEAAPTLTRDFGKIAADTDIFAGWVERMKQKFKDAPSVSSNKLAAVGPGPTG